MKGDFPAGAIMIPAVAGAMLTFPVMDVALHSVWRRRTWDHAERMKALELGQAIPTRESDWARAFVCVMIGAVLPIVSFAITAILLHSSLRFPPDLWLAPVVVSVVAVPCGCRLAGHLFRSSRASEHPAAKPVASPEDYDFAGHR